MSTQRPLSDSEQLVRAFYLEVDAGDANRPQLSEDVRFRFGNNKPGQGRDAVRAWGTHMRELVSIEHRILSTFASEDDRNVVVELAMTYARKDGGGELHVPACTVFAIEDGVITDYRVYVDDHQLTGD